MPSSRRIGALLVVGALAVVAPAALSKSEKKQPKPVGTVEVVSDNVYVRKQLITQPRKVFAGRAVRTSKKGEARIVLNLKKSDCTQFEATRIILRPAPKVALRITGASGEVWCATKAKGGDDADFKAGETKIAAQDPVFGIVVRNQRTVVKVRRGAVVVSGRGGDDRGVVLGRGQQSAVPPARDPLAPEQLQLTDDQKAASKALAAELPPLRDTTPPTVRLLAFPPAETTSTTATFRLTTGEAGRFACRLDAERFHPCHRIYTRRLRLGTHRFSVRPIDLNGNVGEVLTYTWTIVATSPPRIAFVSGRDGNQEIYVMNQDGSGQTRLTTEPAADADPDWSPDGRRIAFHSERDGNSEIYVMNADGSDQVRLTRHRAVDRNPTWSPDGTKLAFESFRDGNRELYVMNADGTGQVRLTVAKAQDFDPAWSPDGNRIAFASDRDRNYEIYVINADGTGETRLTFTTATEFNPNWDPTGSRLAFHSNRDGDFEIFVMNADGSNPVSLTANTSSDYNPAWSPDGTRIAFQSDRDGDSEIYVMNANGTGQTRLTRNSGEDIVPDW
jgi:Tol biopolymer transport system component